MTRPFEIRFAGQVFFELNQNGNQLKGNTVFLAGGKHRRFLHVPLPRTGTLSTGAGNDWPEPCCITIDRTGQEYVAIDLDGVKEVEVKNVADGRLDVDLPHVLDVSRYAPPGPIKSQAKKTNVALMGGLLEELTIAGWITGQDVDGQPFPLTRLCSEVVWRALPLAHGRDHYQLVLRRDKDYTLRLKPEAYGGSAADPVVVFATALCGWTGQADDPNGTTVDFDGPFELFGSFAAPSLRMSDVLKHPKTGACPPSGRRSA